MADIPSLPPENGPAEHGPADCRGEFRVLRLPGGRTRLEGCTWYTFEMFPQGYWTLWSGTSIHRIHRRVLEHIKRLSETAASEAASEAAEVAP